MYHCYFLINYIGPPKVFFSFPLAPYLKSLPITVLYQHELPQLVLFWKADSHNTIFPKMTPNTTKCDTITIRIHITFTSTTCDTANIHVNHCVVASLWQQLRVCTEMPPRLKAVQDNKAGTGKKKTQNVHFTVSLGKAALSHRKPATTGTFPDSCGARVNDKQYSIYYWSLELPVVATKT